MDQILDLQLDHFSQMLSDLKQKIDQKPRDHRALQKPLETLLVEALNLKVRIERLDRDPSVSRQVGTYTIKSTPPQDHED